MIFDIDNKTTICGIATPRGEGGIGVIRLSGPETVDICNRIFFKAKEKLEENFLKVYWSNISKRKNLIHGYIIDPFEYYVIDEVLLALMKNPHSYTKEDVIEIQSHSGPVILEKIFGLLIQLGAQIATPGEFTKRAFLNGRIDLTQAEAVIDLIEAKNLKTLKIATASVTGQLSQNIKGIRNNLLEIVAEIQAVVEFPEEVFEISDRDKWSLNIRTIIDTKIRPLIENFNDSKVFRNGLKIGIIGRPNVGKSSLLNVLVDRDRAIVTEIPGTTRDIVEDRISLQGVEIILYDTAGIRQSENKIEKIGIKKSYGLKDDCDLIFFVIDALEPFCLEDIEIYNSFSEKHIVFLVNKIDLVSKEVLKKIQSQTKLEPYLYISALKNEGIDKVKEEIKNFINRFSDNLSVNTIAPNLRQSKLLMDALYSLEKSIEEFNENLPEDIIAFRIEEAIIALGKIIGENIEPDILDTIFANFCIGK